MTTVLKHGWKFKTYKNEKEVSVPHDYAIEGPFSITNDVQTHKGRVFLGRTGGLPIAQSAIYEKEIQISSDTKYAYLQFDGVMSNSKVFIDGVKVGERPYGYISFEVDITDYVKPGENHTLKVTLDPRGEFSRWYPGAGIYREVRLVEKTSSHIKYMGTKVIAQMDGDTAEVFYDVDFKLCKKMQEMEVVSTLFDNNGNVIKIKKVQNQAKAIKQFFNIENPKLWSPEEPNLYYIETKVFEDGKEVDCKKTTFGVRTIYFNANKGFYLNGKYTNMNGVCLHHDYGMLGTAENMYALERKLDKLREMGVNAIRTSHNPVSPQFLDMCDQKGFMVIEEAFDEWWMHKVAHGYADLFDKWWKTDIQDMVKRDINHPCIMMWSIGNEIFEQTIADGWKTARMLVEACNEVDNSRPITAGINQLDNAIKSGIIEELDVVGLNYKPHRYTEMHERFPNWIIYGSETESVNSSRGFYRLPVQIEFPYIPFEDQKASSYDLTGEAWSRSPDYDLKVRSELDYIVGGFIWTGCDYLGEPTYCEEWPSRSSYFGVIDLCGIPKDRFYSYQSQWTDKDVLHLLPHWNWNKGDKIDIHCYSSFKEVELFVNGKSLGKKEKFTGEDLLSNRHIWEGVDFEAGEIKAVAVGKEEVTYTIKTADVPSQLKLSPERESITTDEDDIVYVLCEVLDKDGVVCPLAENEIEFSCSENAKVVACDNGSELDTRTFSEPHCTALSGKCMVVVKLLDSNSKDFTVTAKSESLESNTVTITVK